jgi:hypothetical protein
MGDKFGDLAKNMAQCVTRRGAFKKFGLALAGIVLAAVGLPNEAHATKPRFHCHCGSVNYACNPNQGNFSDCVFYCGATPPPRGCAY